MDWPRVRDSLRHHARRPVVRTGIYAVLWCLLWLDARVGFILPVAVQALGFLTALPVCIYWIRHWRNGPPHLRRRMARSTRMRAARRRRRRDAHHACTRDEPAA